ncbi:hypothetical protein NDK43_06970 [Neobacillus pocheonensis]|uniref:Uncharacterized protein n=1 Tax=Neobacillus pocheonensis TaxID=363869 RepID=A0ABT0W785_9BACI|nr:hypothetical protein [Neobacillus pocheonensis]
MKDWKYEVKIKLFRDNSPFMVPIYEQKARWNKMSQNQKNRSIYYNALQKLKRELPWVKITEKDVESYAVRQVK